MLVFFVSHGIIKVSYNFLARNTARSLRFKINMDIFSTVIVLWALSNITVISYCLCKTLSPSVGRSFPRKHSESADKEIEKLLLGIWCRLHHDHLLPAGRLHVGHMENQGELQSEASLVAINGILRSVRWPPPRSLVKTVLMATGQVLCHSNPRSTGLYPRRLFHG